jgi:hypothetical protein
MNNLISTLTDQALIKDLREAVKKEKSCTLVVLNFLLEVDRRVLYASYNCPSLFSFCLDVLGYSEGEAGIRVSAMRLLSSEIYF